MEKDKAKIIEIVGTASERVGSFVGSVTTIGNKIAGLATGSVSAGKEIVGLPNKNSTTVPKKKADNSKAAKLKSDLAATKRKLTETQKAKSKLELQVKNLQTKKESLASMLEQTRSKLNETADRESAVRARAAALESELEEARSVGGQSEQVVEMETKLAAMAGELERVRSEAEKVQSEFKLHINTLQAEKETLSSDLEKTQSTAEKAQVKFKSQLSALQSENELLKSELKKTQNQLEKAASSQDDIKVQTAAFESELAAVREGLAETKSRAKDIQGQLASQLEKLQLEKDSLISELQTARKEADEMKAREDVMRTKVAGLESDITALRSELARARESKSDNNAIHSEKQTGLSDAEEEIKEIAAAPACPKEVESSMEVAAGTNDDEMNKRDQEQPTELVVAAKQISKSPLQEISSLQTEHEEKADSEPVVKEIELSMEVTAQGEPIDVNVENVEEPELEPQPQAEPEVELKVKVTEPVNVTAEDVQAADFKNGTERIIFTRALSDFSSADTAARVDAARAIGGIAHDLSAKVLIAHAADEPSAVVRQECIKALTTLERKEGLSAVESALTDEAASVRLAAVWGIYRLTGVKSVPALTKVLSDRDEGVKRRAVTCIGWLSGQIETIGHSQLRRVISALIECLNDPAESIRKATLDALQAVTGKKMLTSRTSPERLIEQWRNWWKTELLM